MKKYSLFLAILFILLSVTIVFAQQLQTNSNTVRTRVGNPPAASSCPIPGGVPSCGSRSVPVSGCGHCGVGYGAFTCNYESIPYAMDVPGAYGQEIILPTIGDQEIKWTFVREQVKSDGRTAIQNYGGINETTGEQYWLQFHHTAPGSGGGTRFSGDVGARICSAPCEVGTGPHVHIEFARIGPNGTREWLDAPLYFCGS